MRKKIATLCLLAAWLCATGAVSDVAQVVAWARMFAGYARALPVGEALAETFDASKPCELCVVVKKTRSAEEGQPTAASVATAEKILLICSVPVPVVFSAPAADWPATANWKVCSRTESVPVPPPRA